MSYRVITRDELSELKSLLPYHKVTTTPPVIILGKSDMWRHVSVDSKHTRYVIKVDSSQNSDI